MPKFMDLVSGGLVQIEKTPRTNGVSKRATKGSTGVGCEHCPLDKAKGINKVRNVKKVKGKQVFVWSQAPGSIENQEGIELVGPAGKFFWHHMKKYAGLTRKDCDVQNVVRCWPTVIDEQTGRLKDRAPTTIEAKCCSIYTDRAIERNASRAKVHIVLGQFAAKTLLKKEYRKDNPVFWSERFKAHVVCLDHPSYFLRGGTKEKLEQFRRRLESIDQYIQSTGKFGFIQSQDYHVIKKAKKAKSFLSRITRYAEKTKKILSVDIEEGTVKNGKPSEDDDAKKALLCIGISHKPGHSTMIALDHPENNTSSSEKRLIKKYLRRFLKNNRVKKTFHWGRSDTLGLEEHLGVKTKGFVWDTNYSAYLKWPDLKAYGLDNLSYLKFPSFATYKKLIEPYKTSKEGKINFARIPLKILRWYNGVDCDLGKRLQIYTKDVPKSLLKTYISASYVVGDMQGRGPLLDYKYMDDVAYVIPIYEKKLRRKLIKMSGDKEFNPRSVNQIKWLLYEHLEIESLEPSQKQLKKHRGKTGPILSTDADTLNMLTQIQSNPAPGIVKEWREVDQMKKNFLKNYKESADAHDGELRTNWWLTGAITGRMRSGGKAEKHIVNFQNLHGDKMLQNLLISDKGWRTLMELFPEKPFKKLYDKVAEKLIKAYGTNDNSWYKIFNGDKDKGPKGIWERFPELTSFFIKHWEEFKYKIRKSRVFLGFDYKAIEIRILAEVSGDPLLIKQFQQVDLDIHCLVGHTLTGWSYDDIKNDKVMRTAIKALHFGIVYGKTVMMLYEALRSEGVKITKRKTQELYDAYFRNYNGVRRFMERVRAFAEKNGFVETLFGPFRRPINVAGDEERGTFWANQAVNTPVQGTAHQLLLFALALLKDRPEKYPLLQTPVMEVHDALIFYTLFKDLRETFNQGRNLLEKDVVEYIKKTFGYKMRVPIFAEGKAGWRLGVMPEYKGESCKVFAMDWMKQNVQVESQISHKWMGKAA